MRIESGKLQVTAGNQAIGFNSIRQLIERRGRRAFGADDCDEQPKSMHPHPDDIIYIYKNKRDIRSLADSYLM